MVIRMYFVVLLLSAIIGLSGCARTVTPVITYGEELRAEVTLRGTAEVDPNRYFLVVGDSSALKTPPPPPDNLTFEMIEPGTTPIQGLLADYYTNYYSTWSGYAILEPAGYFLVKGPFLISQTTTRESLGATGAASNKLLFNFTLSRIFGAAVPDRIYFDVVTVPWPNALARVAADHLSATDNYISKIAGSIVTINDVSDGSLDPALDIISVKVETQ